MEEENPVKEFLFEYIKNSEKKFHQLVITSYSIHYTKLYDIDIYLNFISMILWKNNRFSYNFV